MFFLFVCLFFGGGSYLAPHVVVGPGDVEFIGWFKISAVTGSYTGSCLDEYISFCKLEAGISGCFMFSVKISTATLLEARWNGSQHSILLISRLSFWMKINFTISLQ